MKNIVGVFLIITERKFYAFWKKIILTAFYGITAARLMKRVLFNVLLILFGRAYFLPNLHGIENPIHARESITDDIGIAARYLKIF